jgi:hypothetical protein
MGMVVPFAQIGKGLTRNFSLNVPQEFMMVDTIILL